jgi:hypothetical protein
VQPLGYLSPTSWGRSQDINPDPVATVYNEHFFRQRSGGALSSARVVAPIISELIRPSSVCDVGGGVGAWLVPFIEIGCQALCLDGWWVDRRQLLIDSKVFREVDLRQLPTVNERFDLVLCLEVAEHLEDRLAGPLVGFLTQLAPAVLFSSAIPGQGGNGHVNEQPNSFWRRLFEARGYSYLDPVRRHVWQNPSVDWWYQQNLRLYVDSGLILTNKALLAEQDLLRHPSPELYADHIINLDGRLGRAISNYRKFRRLLNRISVIGMASTRTERLR